jgi:hypothetical protein
MKRTLLLLATIVVLWGFVGSGANAEPAARVVEPRLELERLPPGPLPGVQVRGDFRIPGRGAVPFAQRLIVTGKGARRTALLIARGSHHELCFTAVVGAPIRRALFTCLERWDRPPMLIRVAAGGKSQKETQWLALVGLVRREVTRVTVMSQVGVRSHPRLDAWRGFPWKAFATPTAFRYRLPSEVYARDQSGTVQDLDLGWSYGAACGQQGGARCTPGRLRAGSWTAVRDPLARGTAPFIQDKGGLRAKRLTFDHPIMRQLVAGQAFSIGRIALWSKCDGGLIGAVVPFRLVRPIDFEGDVPVRDYDANSHTAYLEGVAHLRVETAVSFDIYVDLNLRKVVGIYVAPYRRYSGMSKPKVDFKLIGDLRPAGGPDRGNCGEAGD